MRHPQLHLFAAIFLRLKEMDGLAMTPVFIAAGRSGKRELRDRFCQSGLRPD
jgi:hypothetical protein